MQQLVILLVINFPQHVSGVFTPILRRSDCFFTAYGYLSRCDCCDVGESGGKLCALCGVGCLTASQTQSDLLMMGVETPETC